MTDEIDFKALWLEERAEVKRLTKALVDLKKLGMTPTPERKPAEPVDGPRLPPRVVASLGKLEAQLKAARPDLTDDLIHAEAIRMASETFPDAG